MASRGLFGGITYFSLVLDAIANGRSDQSPWEKEGNGKK